MKVETDIINSIVASPIGTSWDTSDNVCQNLKIWGYHFYRYYHHMFDVIDQSFSVRWYRQYHSYVVKTSRSFPHSWPIIGFITRLTRRISLVKQELLTLPEHLSSPLVFSGVHSSCYSIFSFMCMFCRSFFVLLYFFCWPLCCLFFNKRILITLLVSSNSS
jgi:hypothetical protein